METEMDVCTPWDTGIPNARLPIPAGILHHRPAGILGFFHGKPIFQIFVLSSQTETLYAQNNYVNDGPDDGQRDVHNLPGS